MYDSFQEPLDAGINDKGSCEGGGLRQVRTADHADDPSRTLE
jgi:hypothetical protein